MRPTTKIGTILTVLVASLFLSGCGGSEQERNFDVPDSLCGVPVSGAALGKVLPASGTKLSTEQGSDRADGERRCRISVDGKVVLSSTTAWWEKGTTLSKVAFSQIGVDLDEHVSSDGNYGYGDKGAVARVECPDPTVSHRKDTSELYATIFITSDGTPDESAMKKLITSYAAAVTKSGQCTNKG